MENLKLKILIYPLDITGCYPTVGGFLSTGVILVLLNTFLMPFILFVLFPIDPAVFLDKNHIKKMKIANSFVKLVYNIYIVTMLIAFLLWFLFESIQYRTIACFSLSIYFGINNITNDIANDSILLSLFLLNYLALELPPFMHNNAYNLVFNYGPFIIWLNILFNDIEFAYRRFFFNKPIISRLLIAYALGFISLLGLTISLGLIF